MIGLKNQCVIEDHTSFLCKKMGADNAHTSIIPSISTLETTLKMVLHSLVTMLTSYTVRLIS